MDCIYRGELLNVKCDSLELYGNIVVNDNNAFRNFKYFMVFTKIKFFCLSIVLEIGYFPCVMAN